MENTRTAETIWPTEILNLPKVEVPVSGVTGHTIRNAEKQVTFFSFAEGTVMPDHSHAAQWGYLVSGEMTLQMEGRTELFESGDIYHIPAGVSHRASFSRDSFVIDMGDDPERYKSIE